MVAADSSSSQQQIQRSSSLNNNDNDDTTLLLPSLVIPITSVSSSSFIEIFPEELVDISANSLMQVLRDENANLDTWADASLLYIQQGHVRESCSLLQAACDLPYNNNRDARVRLLASAGIAHLELAKDNHTNSAGTAESSSDFHEELRALADQRFTQSTKVDTLFPMQWIGRGMLNLSVGRMDQARFFFETTLKQCGQVLPALLGMAAVSYGEGHYAKAQEYYGKAMRLFPKKSGAATRVGFGLASVKLGQVDRAKAALERALQLDPENVAAMVASALLDMAAVDQHSPPQQLRRNTETAIKKISMANLLDHDNAMVQNHLANHYFWKWTPVVGMNVLVEKNSTLLKSGSQPLALEPGERIRVGPSFETYIVSAHDDDDDVVTMRHAWPKDSQSGLKLWKRDYDRVVSLAKGALSSTLVPEMQAESLLHQARVHHVKNELDQAHLLYQEACKRAPDLSPARFGLAQTLIEKEDYDHAAAHLRMVLKTNATATDALAVLGLLECRKPKSFAEGLQYLKKAISLDPLNPQLYLLEALALQQRQSEYPAALERYKKAVQLLEKQQEAIPYHVLVNSGVLCHETNKFDDALRYYTRALETLDADPQTALPSLENTGMEGGTLRHDDNSMFCDLVDTNLQAQASEGDNADKKVVQLVGDATNVLVKGDHIKLGDVLETQIEDIVSENGATSLKLMHELNIPEPTDEEKQQEEPEFLPIKVVRENQRLKGNPSVLSVAFNIARLHEAAGRMYAAVELHKAIVKRNPTYTNSYLRLACIARDCGSLKECTTWLQLSRMSSPDNNETLTLMGNLHLSLCDWPRAQSVFDTLLSQKVPNAEAYAMLSLGNIYFANLKTPRKYAKHLQYAADYYKRILTKDKANMYAANGLGTILAEKGELFKAKQVFNRVREVSGDTIADAHVNLGHIYLAQKKHPEALQMYQSYMNKAQDVSTPVTSKSRKDNIIEILHYIAFAYFDWARQTEAFNDVRAAPADGRYKKCMEHLELAMKKSDRENSTLKYNYCMTKLQAANCVLQKLTRNIRRTAQEVEEALEGLEQSLPQVQQILQDKQSKRKEKKVSIPTSFLQDFITNCKANIESAKSHLEEERKKEEDAKAVREMQQWEAETQRKEREVQLLEKQAQEAKEQELREKKARAKMLKLEQLQQTWQEEADAKKAAEDKRKSRKNPPAPDVVDEQVFDNQVVRDETAALFEDSDSDNEEQPEQTNESAVGVDDKDDDAMQEAENEEKKANVTETATEKDLFGESSSEEDAESDEELVPASGTKRSTPGGGDTLASSSDEKTEGQQPAKKRRVMDEDDDE